MEYMDIMFKAYDVADEIKKTPTYLSLIALKKRIECEKSTLLKEFKEAKEKYYEALKYGNYHPDLKKYQANLMAIKTKLFNDDLVFEYKNLERQLQQQLNNITNQIKKVVSEEIALVNELGFLEKRGKNGCKKTGDSH